MVRKSLIAALAVSTQLFVGGFGLQLGNPEASPEARSMNAVFTVESFGCLAAEKTTVTGDIVALRRVLSQARPRDLLTLWRLLSQAPPGERPAVFDRFAQLAPLPPQATRENALKLDRRTIDLCWNALNLENTEWWRGWKRQW